MNIKLIVAAALCVLPLLSQAGVVYRWQALNNETPRGITLELEFDRKTVKNGAFHLNFNQEEEVASKQGLLNLRYSYAGSPWPAMVYSAKNGGFDDQIGSLSLHIAFDNEGFLTGYIFSSDQMYQHFEMESDARIFTVLDARTEFDGMEVAGCTFGEICSGAMGYIRRVRDVPEPISLSLLAIGATGIAAARRRKGRTQ